MWICHLKEQLLRHAPDYLVRLLEYYIRIEQITKDKVDAKPDVSDEQLLGICYFRYLENSRCLLFSGRRKA